MSDGATFRQLLERDDLLVCPGAHDPLTARIVDMADFDRDPRDHDRRLRAGQAT